MSNGSISIRKFIRWLPDEASEPTSTLVLTSPQRRYVDLRILSTTEDESAPNSGLGAHRCGSNAIATPADRY